MHVLSTRSFSSLLHPTGSIRFPRLYRNLGILIDVCLALLLLVIPLFFLPQTLDVLEFSKQTLLLVLTIIAGLGAGVRFFLARHGGIGWHWLHVGVLLFLLVHLVSSAFSQDPYASFVGSLFVQPAGAFITLLALVSWYFIITERVRTITQVYNLTFIFLFSSFLAALYGFAQMMGWHLFSFEAAQTSSFSSVGSVYGLAAFLTAPLVIASAVALHGCRDHVCLLGQRSTMGTVARVLVWCTFGTSFVVMLLVDYWPAWIATMIGVAVVVLLGLLRARGLRRPIHLAVAVIVFIISGFLLFVRSPIPAQLPTEVVPSFGASFQIAREALQENPVFGTGPGTWAYNYGRYRVSAVNESSFWNIRFDRGLSTFLTMLATMGIAGSITWLGLILAVGFATALHLSRERDDDVWYGTIMLLGGFTALAVTSFVSNFQMVHNVFFWILFAILVRLLATHEIGLSFRSAWGWLVGIGVGIGMFILVCGFWLVGQRLVAETSFAQAVRIYANGGALDEVIKKIEQAHLLNPQSDLYERNLAQAYALRVSQAMQKNPSTETFQSVVSPDIIQAFAFAKGAVARVPSNVDNWANLGFVYASVMNAASGADVFALGAYQEAYVREPHNPMFLSEIGSIHLWRSDTARALASAQDPKTRAQTQAQVVEELRQAEIFLRRAVDEKSDYLPARYRLGMVYEREGKIPESIAELENVLRVNSRDVGVAFELALLYYRNREAVRALDLMQQIAQVEPNNPNVNWYLSALYEEQGKLDQAIERMQLLAKLLPDNTAIQQRLENLLQIRGAAGKAPAPRTLPDPLPEAVTSPTSQPTGQKK